MIRQQSNDELWVGEGWGQSCDVERLYRAQEIAGDAFISDVTWGEGPTDIRWNPKMSIDQGSWSCTILNRCTSVENVWPAAGIMTTTRASIYFVYEPNAHHTQTLYF